MIACRRVKTAPREEKVALSVNLFNELTELSKYSPEGQLNRESESPSSRGTQSQIQKSQALCQESSSEIFTPRSLTNST